MTSTADATNTFPIYHLEVTDEHTIVLPPDLRERLGVEAGDVLAISVVGGQGRVYKTTRADAARPVVTQPVPDAKGLLADYFKDWDDINRFVQEERRGWEERENG